MEDIESKHINNVKIPESEALILEILASLGKAHAPAISRASQGKIPSNSVYILLKRLLRRKLVKRLDGVVAVNDIEIKRVMYESMIPDFTRGKYDHLIKHRSSDKQCESVN